MATYKLEVSYDGTNYYGFQRLTKLPAIQGIIEDILSKVLNTKIMIQGSSRTDKGVHAHGQVISFKCDLPSRMDLVKLLNSHLPDDIRILSSEVVNDDFHPRRGVKAKLYRYKIEEKPYDVVNRNYYLQYPYKIDTNLLREALRYFEGIHDFHNYMIGDSKTTVRQVFETKVIEDNNHIYIDFIGSGFLRGQIRMMVGVALKYAQGKIDKSYIINSLKENNLNITYKVSGCGLYLEKIYFE